MDARQSTSYLPPTTGPINQAMEDYSAFSFTYNYPQLYQLASHESTATETPTTSRTNFLCACLLIKMASKTVTRSIFLYPTLSNIICESRLEDKGNWIDF